MEQPSVWVIQPRSSSELYNHRAALCLSYTTTEQLSVSVIQPQSCLQSQLYNHGAAFSLSYTTTEHLSHLYNHREAFSLIYRATEQLSQLYNHRAALCLSYTTMEQLLVSVIQPRSSSLSYTTREQPSVSVIQPWSSLQSQLYNRWTALRYKTTDHGPIYIQVHARAGISLEAINNRARLFGLQDVCTLWPVIYNHTLSMSE